MLRSRRSGRESFFRAPHADGETLIEVPLTVGVIGAVAALVAAAAGAVAALAADYSIAIERERAPIDRTGLPAVAPPDVQESSWPFAFSGNDAFVAGEVYPQGIRAISCPELRMTNGAAVSGNMFSTASEGPP
jgi:hypothetical protein